MSAVIFAGPSLRDADRRAHPGLEFRPPARQGDLYAAACARPVAIGLIDGYFDGVPAVLHKEILWALAQGIAVFGGASMGALRAAEMQGLGMIGIGRIFADYRDEVLTDDDEVALIHGPAELDHPALSLPMVDLRASLALARDQGVVDDATARAVIAEQKAVFYPRRSWPDLLAGLIPRQPALAAWLARHRVDQKRADALALLAAVEAHLAAPPPPTPLPRFQPTAAWTAAPWRDRSAETDSASIAPAILDQLRLDPAAYRRCRRQALLRHLAAARAEADAPALAASLAELRLSRGLLRQADLAAWAEAQDLDEAGLARLLGDHAAVEALARALDARLGAAMLDQLRWDGDYGDLRAKARARLDAAPGSSPPPPPLLLDRFFRTLGLALPSDLAAFAEDLGLSGLDAFLRLLAADHARRDNMSWTAENRSDTL